MTVGPIAQPDTRGGSKLARDHGLTPLPSLRSGLPPEGGSKDRDSRLATCDWSERSEQLTRISDRLGLRT